MIAHLNRLWADSLIAELAGRGVSHFCVTPGSRSSPLLLALERNKSTQVWAHLDERSSAFFALGIGKSTGIPAVVITTSGTAVANLLPAVVEAHQSGTPLILLTADRPPRLRGTGAPQTIDQLEIFGRNVRWFFDCPVPSDDVNDWNMVLSLARLAVSRSLPPRPGPTHLNFPLDEPLIPPPDEELPDAISILSEQRETFPEHDNTGENESEPVSADVVATVATSLAQYRHGLIICGEMPEQEVTAQSIAALARKLTWPILADIASQMRFGLHDKRQVISSYDALLRSESFRGVFAPDCVLQLGSAVTSKALYQYLSGIPNLTWMAVNDRGLRIDPNRQIVSQFHGDIGRFCTDLTNALGDGDAAGINWLSRRQKADNVAKNVLRQSQGVLGEGDAVQSAMNALPEGGNCFLSNSMPIRDADCLVPPRDKSIRVIVNRGANGIDGVVSSAAGICASQNRPTLLILGDLALYHDMNGLLALRRYSLPLVICIVQNDGGGIFEFLPIADYQRDVFERYFGTPHGLEVGHIAKVYGLFHTRTTDHNSLQHEITAAFERRRPALVEFTSDRKSNVAAHRQYWKSIADALVREGLC